jgi:hypothetical protein
MADGTIAIAKWWTERADPDYDKEDVDYFVHDKKQMSNMSLAVSMMTYFYELKFLSKNPVSRLIILLTFLNHFFKQF